MKNDVHPSVTIKLKPYLQEYLLYELRTNLASKRNIIGILLKPFLELMPDDVPPSFPKGREYITFELPYNKDINIRGNIWISPKNQEAFEQYIEWHFKQLFFHYMNDKVRYYRSFKKAILQFCGEHEFPMTYINYEMLKKDFYRKRARKNAENSLPLSVPGMSPGKPSIFLTLN